MKSLVMLFVFAGVSAAQAGIPLGTYKGFDENKQPCEVEVISIDFRNNQKHPLNERVVAKYDGYDFELLHPPVVSLVNGTISVHKDHLSDTYGLADGSVHGTIVVDHSAAKHAPSEFLFVREHKSPVKPGQPSIHYFESRKCLDLEL